MLKGLLSCICCKIHLITGVWYNYVVSCHCRTALARMLSVDAYRSDPWRGLANTYNDHDKNVSIGLITSPIYVITHSRRQQIRTNLHLLFICFAVVFSAIKSAYNAWWKENRVSVFWYQVYQLRPETRRTGSASLAIPTLFLVSPDKLDIKRHLHGVLFSIY